MVAKSYAGLEVVGEPYEKNKKKYVKVKSGGSLKEVRWYSDAEYARMYPDEVAKSKWNAKKAFGFDKGYITIFGNSAGEDDEWFAASKARYSVKFGWYFVSQDEVPELPTYAVPKQLEWDRVGNYDGTFKPDYIITSVVKELFKTPNSGKYAGAVGQRIEKRLTVTAAAQTETKYGISTEHSFVDDEGNSYSWKTSARSYAVGEVKTLKGSIKELKDGVTVLTRCLEV